jgi:hypothetical protein
MSTRTHIDRIISAPLNGETRYYHSVPTAGGMAEDYVIYSTSEQTYRHITHDEVTGRSHTRFFDSLHEFVDWHFQSHGWDPYENYSVEDNVKVSLSQVYKNAVFPPRIEKRCW